MNGLHLCRDCREPFELDALNWNDRTNTGKCDACTKQYYATHTVSICCCDCGRTIELDLAGEGCSTPQQTEVYLLTGMAACIACAATAR